VRVALRNGSIEVEELDGDRDRPPLLFLHEGLGSVGLWRQFPRDLTHATGRRGVVYSRYGYGHSDPWIGETSVEYMHNEALVVLPELLGVLEIASPVLIGHSDGASIALIFAGAGGDSSGLVLLAPHVFVEDRSIAGVESARDAFLTTDLAERMAKHHDAADDTFWRWNDIWLAPEFRSWNIEDSLARVTAPVLLLQGSDDPYGTLRQLDAIETGVPGPVERLVLEGCGHAPHLDRPTETLQAVTHFLTPLDGVLDRPV
jgi:pimeloyl-ACP methyl ester carboxylesterase